MGRQTAGMLSWQLDGSLDSGGQGGQKVCFFCGTTSQRQERENKGCRQGVFFRVLFFPRSFSEKFLRVALEPVTKFLVFASDLERGGLLWPSLCDFLL